MLLLYYYIIYIFLFYRIILLLNIIIIAIMKYNYNTVHLLALEVDDCLNACKL